MFMWSEEVAGRGADDIISCLKQYITTSVPDNVRHLIVYSDSCFGQNKNLSVVSFWMYLTQSGRFDVVEHKYLVPGHTYLPCDRDFGLIEKKKRQVPFIYVPDHWMELVKKTRVKKPFKVVKMTRDMFITVKPLLDKVKRRAISESGHKVLLSKITWLKVMKDTPFKFSFKYTYGSTENFDTVDIRKKRVPGRPSLTNVTFPLKYDGPRPIKAAKLKDLKQLLNYIPPVHHEYYRNLKPDTSSANIIDDALFDTTDYC